MAACDQLTSVWRNARGSRQQAQLDGEVDVAPFHVAEGPLQELVVLGAQEDAGRKQNDAGVTGHGLPGRIRRPHIGGVGANPLPLRRLVDNRHAPNQPEVGSPGGRHRRQAESNRQQGNRQDRPTQNRSPFPISALHHDGTL
jgi:hypothetical protein